MKKFVATVGVLSTVMLVGCAEKATAASLDLTVGKDRSAGVAVTSVAVGKDFGGLNVSGQLGHANDNYTTYGVGADLLIAKYGPVDVGVIGKVAYVDPKVGVEGWIGSYGVSASYDLSKSVAVKAEYTRIENIQDASGMKDNQFALGLSTKF